MDYDEAEYYYTHGACHFLAFSLANIIKECQLLYIGGFGHACIVIGDDVYDITGKHTLPEMLEKWYCAPHQNWWFRKEDPPYQLLPNDQQGRTKFLKLTEGFKGGSADVIDEETLKWAEWVIENYGPI